jgi:hypothetical protein
MKTTKYMIGVLVAGAFVLAGCGKQPQQGPGTAPVEMRGVKVDLPKMQEAFANEKPELRAMASNVSMDLRYGKYADALMKLDKLAAQPGLTDPEKQVVNDVIGQVKQVAAKAPAQ